MSLFRRGWSLCIAWLLLAIGASAPLCAQPAHPDIHSAPRADAPTLALAHTVKRELGLRSASIFELPFAQIEDDAVPEVLRVPLIIEGRERVLELRRHSVRSEQFTVLTETSQGWIAVYPGPVRTYRGSLLDEPGSVVAAALLDDGLSAQIITTEGKRFILEPLAMRFPHAAWGDHALYPDDSPMDDGARCGVPAPSERDRAQHQHDRSSGESGCGGDGCIAEIACDTDVEFIAIWGSGTTARIESIINTVNIQFERDVNITHQITTILLRPGVPPGNVDSDPYSSTQPQTLLNQMVSQWQANHQDITHDVAQLFTGKDLDGDIVGFANFGSVCLPTRYSVVQNRSVWSRATDLTAHELGHNWGAVHCNCAGDENTGYTMNATLTGANRFHPTFTIPNITSFRDSRACLTPIEAETTPFPLSDDFEVGAGPLVLNPALWTGIDGAIASTLALNEPSGTVSMRLNGAAEARSARMDTSLHTNLQLAYAFQRGGGGDPPGPSDQLIVEYRDSANKWIIAATHSGTGASSSAFSANAVNLPAGAEHSALRIRFRATGSTPGLDDWFIDDVLVTGILAPPGPVGLSTPLQNQQFLPLAPAFSWSPGNRADTYRLIVSSNPALTSPVIDHTTPSTSFTPGGSPLAAGTTYYWKVIAINDHGQTDSIPTPGVFSTTGTLPGSFQLLDPGPSVNIATTTPKFTWQTSAGAQTYRILIDRFFDFNNPIHDVTFPAPGGMSPTAMYNMPPGILQGQTGYYWKVIASNSFGNRTGNPSSSPFFVNAAAMNCPGDADSSGTVDIDDLTFIVLRLGTSAPNDGGADVDGSGMVDIDDLTYTILRFGPCP